MFTGAGSGIGAIGFTKQLAAEYGAQGVRVNAICPGAVETPVARTFTANRTAPAARSPRIVPADRCARPEEIAELALVLASDDSSFACTVRRT